MTHHLRGMPRRWCQKRWRPENHHGIPSNNRRQAVQRLGSTSDAKIGVFITLAPPTGPMTREAIKAGFYETEYGKYPKLQILTIEDLFAGKKPDIPLVDPSIFKKAAKEPTGKQPKLL